MSFYFIRITSTFLILTGLNSLSLAQYTELCGTKNLSKESSNFLETQMRAVIAKQYNLKQGKVSNAGTTCIPIKVHDIRTDGGTGAVDLTELNKGIANLNYNFQTAGIEFFLCGAINSVNSSTYYDFDTPEEPNLISVISPQVTNAFNLYLTNSVASSGSPVAGYAYFPGNNAITTVCIMDKNIIASYHNGTLVHEYGHHFNLQHTHNGTENGNTDANAENVPRSGGSSNCTTRGDFVCDTDADPRGSIASCIYTGGGINTTDILGNPYTPPIDNIMSYYSDQCGGLFTAGQYTRISAALTVRQGHSAYSLNCTPTAVTVPSGLTALQIGNAIVLNWTDNAANESGYLIERSTTSAAAGFRPLIMGGVGPNITTYNDNAIASTTTYYYRIKSSNGNCNSYSNVATVTSTVIYCLPTYIDAPYCANSTISNVTFNGLTSFNNNSGCTGNAYTDYSSSITASVQAGNLYNFSISKINSYSRYIQVYIDFNANGNFNDPGEKILPDNTAIGAVYSGSVTIPPGAVNGTTRMRVIMKNAVTISSACESNMTFGESEDYGLSISGGALPISLISFNGIYLNDAVKLYWATAHEVNSKSFYVEKSNDGTTYITFDTLKSNLNSDAIQQYYTWDNHPSQGLNYYRLKLINQDNTFEYSPTIIVNSNSNQYELSVYPNPTTDAVFLSLNNSSALSLDYHLVDPLGNKLRSNHLTYTAGGSIQKIDLSELSKGIYHLNIVMDTQVYSFKIIKQ